MFRAQPRESERFRYPDETDKELRLGDDFSETEQTLMTAKIIAMEGPENGERKNKDEWNMRCNRIRLGEWIAE